ncbi:MAG: hypothetical protein GXY52_03200 [Chloroflexi bacterium]|nr:hypothetical protein [Chloroflexota bacterium]
MKKTIVRLLLVMLCAAALTACAQQATPLPKEEATVESKATEAKPAETKMPATETPEAKTEEKPTAEPEKTEESKQVILEPGIQGPEGWPEDVPTPLTGEFLWGDWAPDQSFYTVDIRYTQAEIDAYAKRLQDAGFTKIDTDKYEDIYGDAGVYANDNWEIVLGDEGVNGDYTYMSLYPVK